MVEVLLFVQPEDAKARLQRLVATVRNVMAMEKSTHARIAVWGALCADLLAEGVSKESLEQYVATAVPASRPAPAPLPAPLAHLSEARAAVPSSGGAGRPSGDDWCDDPARAWRMGDGARG